MIVDCDAGAAEPGAPSVAHAAELHPAILNALPAVR
jgi:hypothetical protein